MMTEEITINVSPGLARIYRDAAPEERRKLELLAEFGLQNALHDTRTLREIASDISRKARERGLTPEILESILNDEE